MSKRRLSRVLPACTFDGLRFVRLIGEYIKRFDSNMHLKPVQYINPEHNYDVPKNGG